MAEEKIAYQLVADEKGAIKSIKKLEKQTKTSTKNMKRSFKTTSTAIKAGFIAALTASIFKMKQFTSNIINYGDKLNKLSQRVGVSVETLDKLKHIADLSGVSFDSVSRAIFIMQRNLDNASEGVGEASKAMEDLGLNINEILKLKPEEQFFALAKAIMEIENPTVRNAKAMELMGRSAAELITMFPELRKKVKELNATISDEQAQFMADYNDEMSKLWRSITMIGVDITSPFVKGISETTEGLRRLLGAVTLSEKIQTAEEDVKFFRKEVERLENATTITGKMDRFFSLGTMRDNLKEAEEKLRGLREELEKLKTGIKKGYEDFDAIDSQASDKLWEESGKKKKKADEEEIKRLNTISKLEEKIHLDRLEYTEQYRELEIALANQEKDRLIGQAEALGHLEAIPEIIENHRLKIQNINKKYDEEDLRIQKEEARKKEEAARETNRKKEEINKAALDRVLKATREYLDHLDDLEEEHARKLEEISNKIAGYITDPLYDAINGTKDFGEAFKQMAESILRDLARIATQKLILKAITSMGFEEGGVFENGQVTEAAQGGVFKNGQVTAFADGGIVNKPTIFPMANGLGLMGEAGPEAVMPLTRTSSGDLGVKAEGNNKTNVTYVINAVDSQSFHEAVLRNPGSISKVVNDTIEEGDAKLISNIRSAAR